MGNRWKKVEKMVKGILKNHVKKRKIIPKQKGKKNKSFNSPIISLMIYCYMNTNLLINDENIWF